MEILTEQNGVSKEFARFLNNLSSEDKEGLFDVLKDPSTFLAEDMNDVLAILAQLKS